MNPRDSYSNRMTCTLRGGDAIVRATTVARSFGEAQGLSEDELARFCIVIEELVANLYDHGGLAGTDEIELIFVDEPRGIRVTLVDPGKPFDLRTATSPAENGERGGGVGLDIVQAWAEIVGYEATTAGNRLELLLPRR